jgi:hypothetical protein
MSVEDEKESMESLPAAHILVVAHETAVTPALLDAIRVRSARGPIFVHTLVPEPAPPTWPAPHVAPAQRRAEAERALHFALPLIEVAGRCPADGSVSRRHDPMDAIEETLFGADFDEIILSTAKPGVARRLHVDLPSRVAHLGLPLTTVFTDEQLVQRPARIHHGLHRIHHRQARILPR